MIIKKRNTAMAPFILSVLLLLNNGVAVTGQTISTTTTTSTEESSSISEGETYAALGILGFLVLLFAIICADVIHKRFQQNQQSLMPFAFDLDKTLIGRNPNVIKPVPQSAEPAAKKKPNANIYKKVMLIEAKAKEDKAEEEEEKKATTKPKTAPAVPTNDVIIEVKEDKEEEEEEEKISTTKPKTPPAVTMNEAWNEKEKEKEKAQKEKEEKEKKKNVMAMDDAWNDSESEENGDLVVEMHSFKTQIDNRLTSQTDNTQSDFFNARQSTRL